jgi:hypothetical protein
MHFVISVAGSRLRDEMRNGYPYNRRTGIIDVDKAMKETSKEWLEQPKDTRGQNSNAPLPV